MKWITDPSKLEAGRKYIICYALYGKGALSDWTLNFQMVADHSVACGMLQGKGSEGCYVAGKIPLAMSNPANPQQECDDCLDKKVVEIIERPAPNGIFNNAKAAQTPPEIAFQPHHLTSVRPGQYEAMGGRHPGAVANEETSEDRTNAIHAAHDNLLAAIRKSRERFAERRRLEQHIQMERDARRQWGDQAKMHYVEAVRENVKEASEKQQRMLNIMERVKQRQAELDRRAGTGAETNRELACWRIRAGEQYPTYGEPSTVIRESNIGSLPPGRYVACPIERFMVPAPIPGHLLGYPKPAVEEASAAEMQERFGSPRAG